jgi:hypothetical protein
MVTGSPLPTFTSKNPGLDLELRLRIIMAKAALKLTDTMRDEFVNMLKDPVTIGLFVAGLVSFVAVHASAPTGIGAVVALVVDCAAAAVTGFTLGRQAIPFLKATVDFLEATLDGESDEQLDEAATYLAQMISIVVATAATVAATAVLKNFFRVMKSEAPSVTKQPIKDPPPMKREFWMDAGSPIAREPVALNLFKAALIKDPAVLRAAKQAYRESFKSGRVFVKRMEQGFFIVEEADGSLGTIRWPTSGEVDRIKMPKTELRIGRGSFYDGKKVRGTVHTHPMTATDGAAIGNPMGFEWFTGPSEADGAMADQLFRESKGAIDGEHYVVSGDAVFVFDHRKQFAIVGGHTRILGR